MIYPKNSIVEIYSNASGLTDKEFVTEVYMSELATIIKDNPKAIIRVLRKSGVNVPSTITRRQLTSLLIDKLFELPKLRENIGILLGTINAHGRGASEGFKKRALQNFVNANGYSYADIFEPDPALSSGTTGGGTTGGGGGFNIGEFFGDIFSGGSSNPLSGNVNTGQQLGNTAGNLAEGTSAGAQAGGPVGAVIGALVGLTESIFDWKGAKLDAETSAQQYKLQILNQIRDGEKPNYTPYIVLGSVMLVGLVVLVVAVK